jgi:hypothetical protein
VSSTVLRYKNYRFFFFSREEKRMHVHVSSPEGEAKFWLEPKIAVAQSYGLSRKRLNQVRKVVEEYKNEIAKAWKKHFGS